jgi:hypothetical protein
MCATFSISFVVACLRNVNWNMMRESGLKGKTV